METVCDRSPQVVSLFDEMKPYLESQMLVQFIHLNPCDCVLDVGCGNGYMDFFLGWKYPKCSSFIGVDINSHRIREAYQHQRKIENKIGSPLPAAHFLVGDVRILPLAAEKFDVVISNPPFFVSHASRPSPYSARQIERQDDRMTLHDVMYCAQHALRPGGTCFLVFPAERLQDLQCHARRENLVLTQTRTYKTVRKRTGGVSLIKLEKKVPA